MEPRKDKDQYIKLFYLQMLSSSQGFSSDIPKSLHIQYFSATIGIGKEPKNFKSTNKRVSCKYVLKYCLD